MREQDSIQNTAKRFYQYSNKQVSFIVTSPLYVYQAIKQQNRLRFVTPDRNKYLLMRFHHRKVANDYQITATPHDSLFSSVCCGRRIGTEDVVNFCIYARHTQYVLSKIFIRANNGKTDGTSREEKNTQSSGRRVFRNRRII